MREPHVAAAPQRHRQRARPRMAEVGIARRDRVAADRGLPLDTLGQLHLRRDLGHDPVEDLVLVRDVVVERHRLDAEPLRQPAHADRVDPLRVGELEGRPEDAFSAQWSAGSP